jgi:hypothetical protein
MNALPTGLLTIALLLGSALLVTPGAEAATPLVKFGMDAPGVSAQTSAGVKPDYATLWIGPWTLTSGWGGPDGTLGTLKAAGVTPAVHFYYWGDDISPSCVENGCWSSLHKTHKDRAHWKALGDQLASHLKAKMQGAPVVVFLESEFNKRGISTYEPFDGYLAEMAYRLKGAYPNAIVVLGFGNWQSGDWGVFDRAAAASGMVGLQAMRGSTKDSSSAYNGVYDATLAGVRRLTSLFHKPVMLTDVALSSYPEPGYLAMQRDNLQKFFTGLPALRDAGVRAMIYRSWSDAPGMSTANYYGEAERHWGVAHSGGSHKAAAKVWIDGVKAVRAGTTPTATSFSTSSSSTSTSSGFSAQFAPTANVNEWWVDVKVSASAAPTKVEAKVGSGSWTALAKTDYGTWAKSMNAPKGSSVWFRATDSAGHVASSPAFTWMGASSTSSTSSATFAAQFTAKAVGNDHWVEVAVSSSSAIAKVEARLGSGSWTALPKTSWGTYADDLHAPGGTQVTFRATSTGGATATSPTYTWT